MKVKELFLTDLKTTEYEDQEDTRSEREAVFHMVNEQTVQKVRKECGYSHSYSLYSLYTVYKYVRYSLTMCVYVR